MAKEKVGVTEAADVSVADTANFKQSENKYRVVFKQNRSFECVVGRDFLRFEAGIVNPVLPEAWRDGVPSSIVFHPDFKIHSNDFAIIPI